MIGPKKKGHWSSLESQNCGNDFDILRSGRKYKIIKAFRDFDGDYHPIDEEWTFLSYCFLPYGDGLSLFVSLDGNHEWHVRMQWGIEEQKEIIEKLKDHVTIV